MRITPLSELVRRAECFQQLLREKAIDGAILVQNSDLFYFTGSIQRGVLFFPAEGEPVYLVIKDFARARMESGLKNVHSLSGLRGLPDKLTELGYRVAGKVGMELDVLPVQLYQRYLNLLPGIEISDVSSLVRQVRAVKSAYEIAIMQDCAVLAEKTYEYAKTVIEAGKTDLEIAAELECYARKEGHQGVIRFRGFNSELYFGHVFSGADGAVPAYLDAPLGGL